MTDEVWATILALLWLHGVKLDAKDEWNLLAKKAMSWLQANDGESSVTLMLIFFIFFLASAQDSFCYFILQHHIQQSVSTLEIRCLVAKCRKKLWDSEWFRLTSLLIYLLSPTQFNSVYMYNMYSLHIYSQNFPCFCDDSWMFKQNMMFIEMKTQKLGI